jgi:hypothetical protein
VVLLNSSVLFVELLLEYVMADFCARCSIGLLLFVHLCFFSATLYRNDCLHKEQLNRHFWISIDEVSLFVINCTSVITLADDARPFSFWAVFRALLHSFSNLFSSSFIGV